jgi:PAS domain S-box-containing protein
MSSSKTTIEIAGDPFMESNQLNYEEMEALRLTALDLTSELELGQLLQKIIQRAVELLKADGGGIYRYDEDHETLTVVADCGGGHTLLGETLKVGEGMAGRVVKTRKEMIIDDYSQWADRSAKYDRGPFRAVVGVPLVTPAKILGVLYLINYVEDKHFTRRDAHLLSLLASHAAIALANAEEFELHRRTLRQLELLNRLNERLGQALNLEEILQITLEEALKAVRTNAGSIMIRDDQTGALEIRAWIVRGKMLKQKRRERFWPDVGIAGHVASTGLPYNCADTSKSDFFVKSITQREISALLSVPIILHDRVFCIVNADSEQPNFFDDSDIEMLSAVAGHVAIAIESQMLRDVGISLSTLPLEELYPRIVESAAMLTGSEVSTIFLEDETSGSIKRAALFPSSIQAAEEEIRGDGLSRRILDTGEPITITDAQHSDLVRQSVKDRGVQSLMGAPLTVRLENNNHSELKTIGVLFVSTTRTRQFDKRDEEILQSLANQAAIVIERTKNFAELKENVRFKESLLESAFDAIIAVNEVGTVFLCNQSAEKILGMSSHEVVGSNASQYFVRPGDAQKVSQKLSEKGRVVDYPTHVKSKTGEAIPIRLSAMRLENGSVGFFQDRRALMSAKRRIKQLKQLMEAGQGVTKLDDKDGVLKTAVSKTIETLNADMVSLYPYNHELDEIQVPPIRKGLLFSTGNETDLHPVAIVKKVLHRDDIYFSDDVQSDPLLTGSFVKREQIVSALACPLRVRDKTVGIIFCSYREPHPFTDEEEKAMMRLYFSGIAIAIENARLYEEVRQRAKVIGGLFRAGLGFALGSSLERPLRNLLEQARQLTDAEHASIEVTSSEWKAEPFSIVSMASPELQESVVTAPSGQGMPGFSFGSNMDLTQPDVIAHSEYEVFPAHQPSMNSRLGTPIILGETSIGKFYVSDKQGSKPFTKEDEEYLSMLAVLAAIVIERARMQEQSEAVRSINVAFLLLARWSRTLRQKSRSLKKEMNQSDAALILQEMNAILEEMESPIEPGYHSVERNLDQIVDVSELLRDVASSQEIMDRLRKVAATVGVSTQGIRGLEGIDPHCWVTGNSILLGLAFNILLDNAVSAIEHNALAAIENKRACQVKLRVACSVTDGWVRISISDTGGGISPEIQKDLFHVPLNSKKGGFGYGALTVGLIVKVHKGDLKIDRTGAGGTTITIRLPAEK